MLHHAGITPELDYSLGADELVVEHQIESERGFFLFGSTVFTPNVLLPHDPARYTSLDGKALGSQIIDFEVPDDSWVWAWSRWYVDMTADVDDQGWSYAFRFGSKRWTGRHRIGRSFVRQRVWKRPRIKRRALEQERITADADREREIAPRRTQFWTASDEECEAEIAEERGERLEKERTEQMLATFQNQRNDRERVEAILEYIATHAEDLPFLVKNRESILSTIRFPVSRRSLITKLSDSPNPTLQQFVLAPSAHWREEVLRRGEPQRDEDEAQDEGDLEAEI